MKLEYYNNLSRDHIQTMLSDHNILDALAYAMQTGIPAADVLEAFKEMEDNSFWSHLLFRHNWDQSIQLLREGHPVSEVLKSRGVPYYLTCAATAAEKTGRLPETLPIIAGNLKLQRFFGGSVMTLIFRNIFLWLVIILLLVFSFLAVYPNLMKLFSDLLCVEKNNHYPFGWNWEFLICLPLLLVLFFSSFALGLNIRLFEGLYLHLPYLGHLVKRRILYDLSGIFYCLLAGGMDISQAARVAAASEPRLWLRRRLKNFAARLEKGEDWFDAWEREIRLHTPVSRWILGSGHASGHLAESFNELRDILLDENLGSNRRLNTCFSILMILVNAFIVGFLGFVFFSNLTYILGRL